MTSHRNEGDADMKPTAFALAAGLAAGLSAAALADDLKAQAKFTDTGLAFDLQGDYSNLTLTIAGPHRFHASASTRSGSPEIDLRRLGALEDGTYSYHLTGATPEAEKVRTKLDNGRSTGAEPRRSARLSGTFHVKGGTIVKQVPATDRRDRQ
jgi:hypothetical protein